MITSQSDTGARRPLAGCGIGLRSAHMRELMRERPRLGFLELLADNHLAEGGPDRWMARSAARAYPVTLHCIGMSLGSIDALDRDYIRRVRRLADEVQAIFLSDHIAFTRVDGIEYHDLLPLPYTEEALNHLAGRTIEAQDLLGRTLLLENPSRYLPTVEAAIPELEFLAELCQRSGCGLLLDINNAYVCQANGGEDASRLIHALPPRFVGYVHIAGHHRRGNLLVDTHAAPVDETVWTLLRSTVAKMPDVPVLIERDGRQPPFCELLAEAQRVRNIQAEVMQCAA